jgi:hypothetical protein
MASAQQLEDLVLSVANREWSPATVTPRELAETRAVLEGTRVALDNHANGTDSMRGRVRGVRMSGLGENLVPVLRDLVMHAIALELASPSANGREALRAAEHRTADMLAEWTRHVQADGMVARPPFASSWVEDDGSRFTEDDVTEVLEAVQYPAREEMWQLCGPQDLSALDVDAPPIPIRFAPRAARDALAGRLSGHKLVWISSGSFAGLLRLVPLRPGVASSNWGESSYLE